MVFQSAKVLRICLIPSINSEGPMGKGLPFEGFRGFHSCIQTWEYRQVEVQWGKSQGQINQDKEPKNAEENE
jgi:hypothetical protein